MGIWSRQWAVVHRKHHAFTDELEDPHSPAQLGWVRVQLTNVMLYRRVACDPEQVARHARDIFVIVVDRWLFDHALFGFGIIMFIVVVFMGFIGLFVMGFHFVLYFSFLVVVNVIGYIFGKWFYVSLVINL